ncbi:MAG: hypothetical protein ACKVTZ_06145, partial [Bacteroidia bacterium]
SEIHHKLKGNQNYKIQVFLSNNMFDEFIPKGTVYQYKIRNIRNNQFQLRQKWELGDEDYPNLYKMPWEVYKKVGRSSEGKE